MVRDRGKEVSSLQSFWEDPFQYLLHKCSVNILIDSRGDGDELRLVTVSFLFQLFCSYFDTTLFWLHPKDNSAKFLRVDCCLHNLSSSLPQVIVSIMVTCQKRQSVSCREMCVFIIIPSLFPKSLLSTLRGRWHGVFIVIQIQ